MIQVAVNILIAASIYALVGISFALIYNVSRFFHFAHGAILPIGAYGVWAASFYLKLPFYAAVVFGLLLACCVGALSNLGIFRRLQERQAPHLIKLLASLGLYVVLINLLSIIFGDEARTLSTSRIVQTIEFFGARMTTIQVVMVVLGFTSYIIVATWLSRTRVGLEIRALSNDPELAQISGVNRNRRIAQVFALSSLLAGLAGILAGIDGYITPGMGLSYLMMGVVAMFVGGVKRNWGLIFGAIFLASAQNIGAWFLGSHWQETIAFAALLLLLLFRPFGLLDAVRRRAMA